MLAGLDAEQLSFIDQYLSSGQKIVGTTEMEAPDAAALLNSAALVQ
jgi:2-methylcitrate dehydratase PrpD